MSIISPVYRRPIWRILMDGQDLAARINPRFMDLSLNECRGDEADQLDLTLSDHDGLLALPSRNAVLQVAIGWSDTGLIDKGRFTVDEIGYRGAPDVVTIRARSADMQGPLRTRTDRSFHDKTIAQIVEEIALANGLQAVVGDAFVTTKVQHIDQADESDIAFLTRIGKRYDAVATVKDGRLLFMPIQGGKTASGQDMPVVQVYRRDGDQHDFQVAARDAYTGVSANWMDPKQQRRHTVMSGVKDNAKQLRTTYTSEADALAAAQSEWQRIRRGLATMRFTMAWGLPDLSVQHQVVFPDFKAPINEYRWLVKTARHSINDQGLTTALELERDGDDAQAEDDVNDESAT